MRHTTTFIITLAAILLGCHPVRAVAATASSSAGTDCVATTTSPSRSTATRVDVDDKRTDDRRQRSLAPAAQILGSLAPDIMPRPARQDNVLRSDKPGSYGAKEEEFRHIPSREGIDVSHYQGHIDWETVARDGGISYVYAKATEGASYVDATHTYNISMARKHGLKVGSYHYYRPNVNVEQQLQNMISVVLKSDQDLVPMIDIEEDKGVSEEKFISDLTRFIRMVEQHYGKKPLLYSGEYFYNRHFQGLFLDYQWMLARYSTKSPVLKDGKEYLMWQYSDKGNIPGIRGAVDRSCLVGSAALKTVKMQ